MFILFNYAQVIMERIDGSLDFQNKDSLDYAIGFGDVGRNFWMGNIWTKYYICRINPIYLPEGIYQVIND